jgi:hypothetical protein
MSESIGNAIGTNPEPGNENASMRVGLSRPTRACGKCGRKFLLTHVAAHEGACAAIAPVAKTEAAAPKRKSRAAAKKRA